MNPNLPKEEAQASLPENNQNVNIAESNNIEPNYIVYCYRWVVLISYSFAMLAYGASYTIFVVFSVYMQEIYGISHVVVVLTSYIFSIVFPFTNFAIANPIISYKGTKFSLALGFAGMAACLWLRILINQWVYIILIASVVGSFFDAIPINILPKMAANWFPLDQQVAANTIGSIILHIGAIMGSFYALMFIDTEVKDVEKGKNNIFKALVIIALTYTIFFVIGFIFYKDKPEVPPCPSASEKLDNTKEGLVKEQVKSLLKNWDLLFLLLVKAIRILVVNSIGANVSPLLHAYGIEDQLIIASTAAGFLLAGIIGSTIASIIMTKTRRYKLMLYILSSFSTGMHLLIYTVGYSGNTLPILIFTSLFGLAEIPCTGIIIAFMCELAYPVNEAIVYGLAGVAIAIITTGPVLGIAAFFDNADKNGVLVYGIATTGILLLSILILFFINEDLKKTKEETEQATQPVTENRNQILQT